MWRFPVGDAQADDTDLLVALGSRCADAGKSPGVTVELITTVLLDILAGDDRAFAEMALLDLAGQHLALQVENRVGCHPAGPAFFVADATTGAEHFRLLEQEFGGRAQGGFIGQDSRGQAGQRKEEDSHDGAQDGECAYLRSPRGLPASPADPMLRSAAKKGQNQKTGDASSQRSRVA